MVMAWIAHKCVVVNNSFFLDPLSNKCELGKNKFHRVISEEKFSANPITIRAKQVTTRMPSYHSFMILRRVTGLRRSAVRIVFSTIFA